jgi:hypothetical protein
MSSPQTFTISRSDLKGPKESVTLITGGAANGNRRKMSKQASETKVRNPFGDGYHTIEKSKTERVLPLPIEQS